MREGEPSASSMSDYSAVMQWEQGRAREFCRGGDGCPGPAVSNLSFGPDGGGSMIIAACNSACAACIERGMPAAAWVTHPDAWAEELAKQKRKVAGDNPLQ